MIKLHAHQKEVIDQLKTGSILCGGVGSGKSLTALAYFDLKAVETELTIITTARKRDTKEWEQECSLYGLDQNHIIVDSWNNIHKYTNKSGFFIFDEQRVVGSGVWVKSFLKITKRNNWILLTATPGDVWLDYIPVFLANGFYKNRTSFLERHAVYNRYSKYPKIDRYIDVTLLEKHRKDILVYMNYESSNTRQDFDFKVEYDGAKYYKAIKDRWNPYTNEPIRHSGELCYILRKIVNFDFSRLDAVRKIMTIHPKVIIFYNFDYELDMLRTLPTTIGEWNGHKHDPLPTNHSWAYLVQYTAGAEGWNCIDTDTIIFFSLNYSYKSMAQAAGRIDRINTTYKELYYYRLYSSSSIDRGILESLKQKKQFNEARFLLEKGLA